jgi:glycosyltransferase involved in cell wall biosynthesis
MLSAIVIAKDEEKNIGDCLQSLSFADETVVVVDSESRDRTKTIAGEFTRRVFVEEWKGYAETKRIAVAKAAGDWILWIDADERVTPELAGEIRQTLAAGPARAAYSVKRKAFFLGKWIRHGGWYPGRVVRLFRKDSGRFDGAEVHEGLIIEGEVGDLRHALLHYTDDSLERYFRKFNEYTDLAAREMFQRGKAFSAADLFFRPFHLFMKMYVFKFGFLDGMEGFVLAVLSAHYVMVKYAKLWERRPVP